MQCGREIEFSFNKKDYFIAPDYERYYESWNDTIPPYPNSVLYYCERTDKLKVIISGTTEEVICYKFDGKYSLKDNFDLFLIDYVL